MDGVSGASNIVLKNNVNDISISHSWQYKVYYECVWINSLFKNYFDKYLYKSLWD